jgi:YbgC/YbaW family acyl-CoA thioester hydrolase
MSTFTITRRVEFGDTDMAGIMHFSNFARFMEVAETDFLHSLGASVTWLQEGVRYGFPRVRVACDFLKPARFEDLLQIAVTVKKLGRSSVAYQFAFSRDGEAIANGDITAVYCRATGHGQIEALELPADLRTQLSEYLATA